MRHPFERIVSAYNDKMKAGGGQSSYYAGVSKDINRRYRRYRANLTSRNKPDDGMATFEDFVNYLIRVGPPSRRDDHWKQYYSICDPCHFNYDIIMKFDTFEDEFRYIKNFLNISQYHLPAFFPPRRTRTNSNMTSSYLRKIPLMLRRQLYLIYKRDFELFGYEEPSYIFPN